MKKEYAIRCFIDKKRKLTHKLTRKEAKIFIQTAAHLIKYLGKEYKLYLKGVQGGEYIDVLGEYIDVLKVLDCYDIEDNVVYEEN